MQQAQVQRRRRSVFSIRTLLILGALIALAVATVHVVHGSGAKKPARHQVHRVHHRVCRKAKGKHRTCRVVATTTVRVTRYHPTSLETYQMQVMHVLDRHRHVFDHVSYDTSITTIADLTTACSNEMARISIMTDEVDGVPHPGPWYSAVAGFHRRVLQAYHDMASALEVCATGAGNGDGESVATARQDLVSATRELHAVDDASHRTWNRVHWLMAHPKRVKVRK